MKYSKFDFEGRGHDTVDTFTLENIYDFHVFWKPIIIIISRDGFENMAKLVE